MSMELLKNVREARTKLKSRGLTDIQYTDNIEQLTNRVQEIISKMNKAKIDAIRKAEEPFIQELEELDKEMATLILLMA